MTDAASQPLAKAFNEETLKRYIASQPHLHQIFGNDLSDVRVDEIGDGNLNFVFFVTNKQAALAFKQALPYSRMSGGARALTCERLAFETAALREFGRLAPDYIPHIHHFDTEQSLMVMEFLSPHIIMRKGMIDGVEYPTFADHISTYLAKCLYGTSDFALDPSTKREMVAYFARNVELCEITERLIFNEPFMASDSNRWTSPALDETVHAIQNNLALKLRVADLKYKFLTRSEALLHADLHSGSIMLTADETKVIDPEFAVFGPMAFDIGILIGNLLINYYAQEAYATADNDRAAYRFSVLKMIEDIWNGFFQKFCALWHEGRTGGAYQGTVFTEQNGAATAALNSVLDDYLDNLLQDSIGYAATEMIRRTIGRAHVIDVDMIKDDEKRADIEKKILGFAAQILQSPKKYKSITEFLEPAKQDI
ncbi:5-methylthioribose kinase [Paenochrobactrum gallinarii]|uniref:S-methyl-5-thioribose kinase n=1 Tax=Paenochrobactrum gallinarii TaxID=643673 RepID=A0A841LY64_9HYPH|nr:S-methyl-5-thioribose kinase [Paenochrobactrum gallinarii]MBB6262316.1 5-methylthioribose kinase [Paenochrobactrum gallinarii]